MKKAIVYYSMLGNTDYVAKYIANKVDVDLIRLKPKKEYPNKGILKFIWGGKSAIMGETPKLEEYIFNSDLYDEIVFGTPVWAGQIAPPIKTFIEENKDKLQNKKIAIFVCHGGSDTDKVINKFKTYLGVDNLEAELALVDPKDKRSEEKDKLIEELCNMI